MKTLRLTGYSLAAVSLAGIGAAQTRIDLRTQSKTVDFSQANSTLPSKTGSNLPAACAAGETFLKLNAPAGQNLYVCVSVNQWSPQAASGSGMAAELGDFEVTLVSPTVLGVGAKCSAAKPCNVRFGSRVYTITTGASVTLTAGVGTAYIYIDPTGQIVVGHTMTVSCTGCVALPGTTGFPENSIPLYSWVSPNGNWESSGVDRRSWISRNTLQGGTGIVSVEAGGQTTIAVDGTVVPTYLRNSVTLNFPLIAANTCSADLTLSMPGAAAGDAVAPGWPSGIEAGLVGTMWVSAPGQISIRLCALGASVNPANGVFSAVIIRGL
jgi:hypothetical protein